MSDLITRGTNFKRNCELLEGGDGGEVVVVVDFVVSFSSSHHNVETISLPRHDPKSRSIIAGSVL